MTSDREVWKNKKKCVDQTKFSYERDIERYYLISTRKLEALLHESPIIL